MGQIRCADAMESQRSRLGAIVDVMPDTAKELGDRFGCSSYTSLEDALTDDSIDAVWLATGTEHHASMIDACAKAKKPIGVEKPVAATLPEITEAYKVARDNNVPLFCSFQRRFEPSYVRAKNLVDQGAVGTISTIHAFFRDHPVPPVEFLMSGGCPFHDLTVHDIDYILNVMGEDPDQVYARASSCNPELKAAGVQDNATMVLHFPSGTMATLDITRSCTYGYDNRVEIFGGEGRLDVSTPKETEVMLSNKDGIRGDVLQYSFPERFAEGFRLEMEHFIDVSLGQAQPCVTEKDSYMATLIAEKARQSAVALQALDIPSYPGDQ